MRLAQAVLEIANTLEKEIDGFEYSGGHLGAVVKGYIIALRSAASVADEHVANANCPICGKVGGHEHEQWCESVRKAQARSQAGVNAEVARRIKAEEAASGRMVEAVKSGEVATMVLIDPSMPVGAKTLGPGGIYVLGEDDKLHYSEEDTEKVRHAK